MLCRPSPCQQLHFPPQLVALEDISGISCTGMRHYQHLLSSMYVGNVFWEGDRAPVKNKSCATSDSDSHARAL
eukprot:scaffold36873_cov14-Tisochrysis_lutea.AAC.1